MIKNKDGSYNKISVGILFAIAIIGIAMLASVLITDKPDIDFVTALSYGGLITCLLLIFYFGNRILSKSKSSTPSSIPIKNESLKVVNPVTITEPIEIIPEPIKIITEPVKITKQELYEKPKQLTQPTITNTPRRSTSSFNIVTGIVTMVIASVTLMIGLSIVGSIQSSMPSLPQNSQWSTTMTEVTNNVGTAFNLMGIALFVLAAIFIIGLVGGIMGSER